MVRIGDGLWCRVGLVTVLSYVFVQAEDGIRDLVRSRGLGDVYKRQKLTKSAFIFFTLSLILNFVPRVDEF